MQIGEIWRLKRHTANHMSDEIGEREPIDDLNNKVGSIRALILDLKNDIVYYGLLYPSEERMSKQMMDMPREAFILMFERDYECKDFNGKDFVGEI